MAMRVLGTSVFFLGSAVVAEPKLTGADKVDCAEGCTHYTSQAECHGIRGTFDFSSQAAGGTPYAAGVRTLDEDTKTRVSADDQDHPSGCFVYLGTPPEIYWNTPGQENVAKDFFSPICQCGPAPVDCVLSDAFPAWGACSATKCDEAGTQTRTKEVTSEANATGTCANPPESRDCTGECSKSSAVKSDAAVLLTSIAAAVAALGVL